MKGFLCFLLGIIIAADVCLICGCTANSTPPNDANDTIFRVPETLKHIDSGLSALIMLSVLGLAGCLTLFLLLPAAHRASLTLGLASGSVLAVCLLVKVSLPFVMPVAISCLIAATGIGVYEMWYKRKYGEWDKIGDKQGNL